jgi:hypothetical protein
VTEIKWNLEPSDIEWEIDWTLTKATLKDNERIQAKPDKEMQFESECALAHLLMNEVVFLNDHWWQKEWAEDAQRISSINVNCNDVFAWGCADAEELPYREIENLYRMWRKDPQWGAAIWCIIRRKQMPQKPVEDSIRKACMWDLDKLDLGENTMDAECQARQELGSV